MMTEEPPAPERADAKRFLLTWYGITDLRAALGFEETDGPILAALMTRQYSHVLILAYTDPSKTGPDVQRAQRKFVTVVAPALADPGAPHPSRADQTEAVDAFSNTPEGHTQFRDWLNAEIIRRHLGVTIRMIPKGTCFVERFKGDLRCRVGGAELGPRGGRREGNIILSQPWHAGYGLHLGVRRTNEPGGETPDHCGTRSPSAAS